MTKDKTVTMSRELLPCPFCGCQMRIETGRDTGHRMYGDHPQKCVFPRNSITAMESSDHPDALTRLIEDWNTRADPIVEADGMGEAVTFQDRVKPWMLACFGAEILADCQERNHRFLEEALELVQACGATESEAHQLVDYVYGREIGDPAQEVGGVMVTLAALCLSHDLDMHEAGETELERIWTKVEQIRAKQAAKPNMSPLPGVYPDRASQPAPVSVVLPERAPEPTTAEVVDPDCNYENGLADGWNNCLDKVKELNQ